MFYSFQLGIFLDTNEIFCEVYGFNIHFAIWFKLFESWIPPEFIM